MAVWLSMTTPFPKSKKCSIYQTIVLVAYSGTHSLTTSWLPVASILSCEFTISSSVERRSWPSTRTESDPFNGTPSFLGFLFQLAMIRSSLYGTSEIDRWFFALKSLLLPWLLSHLTPLALSPTSRATSMRASFNGPCMAYRISRLPSWSSYWIAQWLSASASTLTR